MFGESLLESNVKLYSRRGLVTALSFGLQSAVVIALIAVPMLYPETLRMGAKAQDYVPVFHSASPVAEASAIRRVTPVISHAAVFRPDVIPTNIPTRSVLAGAVEIDPGPSGTDNQIFWF